MHTYVSYVYTCMYIHVCIYIYACLYTYIPSRRMKEDGRQSQVYALMIWGGYD